MNKIILKKLSQKYYDCVNNLSQTRKLEYCLNDKKGCVVVRLTKKKALQFNSYECKHDKFDVSFENNTFSMWSTFPYMFSQVHMDEMNISFFNSLLNDKIKSIFGFINPIESYEDDNESIYLDLETNFQSRYSTMCMRAPVELACRLFSTCDISHENKNPVTGLYYNYPVIVGKILLSKEKLLLLNAGDIIFLSTSYFLNQAEIKLNLGEASAYGYLGILDNNAMCFTLNLLGNNEMIHYNDHNEDFYNSNSHEEIKKDELYENDFDDDEVSLSMYEGTSDVLPVGSSSILSGLVIELTVQCGTIKLNLDKMNNIKEGSVLKIEDCKPCEATLWLNNQKVASGELVEVNGTLAIQITSTRLKIN